MACVHTDGKFMFYGNRTQRKIIDEGQIRVMGSHEVRVR